jgi:hypothetical protein
LGRNVDGVDIGTIGVCGAKEIESEVCPEKIANESALQHGMLRSKSIGNPSALIRVPKKILPKLRFGDCGVRPIPISKNL